jgi:hypothetical protein
MESEENCLLERTYLIHFLGQTLGGQAHERLLGQGGELDAQIFRQEMKYIVENDIFWDLLEKTSVDSISQDVVILGTMHGGEANEAILKIAAEIPTVLREAVAQRTKSTGSA